MEQGRFAHLYASRVKGAQPSAIREICKLVDRPEVLSLAGGWPDPATFPTAEIQEILTELLASKADRVLQYGTTEGLPALREEMARVAREMRGIDCDPDSLLVLHGSQQGIDLACRVFIEQGDVMLVGLPSYFGGPGSVAAQRGETAGIPVDKDGIIPEEVEKKIHELHRQNRRVKGIYVVPTFQNPTGATMPRRRREALARLAQEHDFLILEDDPYGELRYSGDWIPSIAALDPHKRTIHIHSFSKIFAPGMRLAYLTGDAGAVRKMVIAKQFIDACTNSVAQYVALEYIRRGYLKDRIRRNIDYYRNKRDRMLALLERYFPGEVTWNRPDGGFFIWLTLPPHLNANDLLLEAVNENVAFVAGAPFYVDGSGQNTFRLSFSQADPAAMETAIGRLANLIRKRL